MYNPENQYRCTIIRGKSQTDMEDLLPLYANMVSKYCPCEEEQFKASCYGMLSKALFGTASYETLPNRNLKTIRNHLTEVAGTLLGLYYPVYDEVTRKHYVYESETCKYLIETNDYPTFFKNLCLNFQFPNGAKKINYVKEDIDRHVHIKPYCYVVSLLYYAQNQPSKELLTKQEIGFYVLNNLDVLQGKVPYNAVYNRIMSDRRNKTKRRKLSGSKDWQHIREQFNLLELANIIETDKTYIWLNKNEGGAINCFLEQLNDFVFAPDEYDLNIKSGRAMYIENWRKAYGKLNHSLLNCVKTKKEINILSREAQNAHPGATKSTVDLGDEGEALVFRLEQERVRNYKKRLANKVLLLGKTKGLGYDISSIEASENPSHPEFARYIEVKSTTRTTVPNFDNKWMDSVNLTKKEWTAAEQYKEYYYIYRVYFTKTKNIVVRMKNPFQKAEDGEIEVYPTIFNMSFGSAVIELCYAEQI